MSDKKYFWLKLPRNFFDKHYVKILMDKENGMILTLLYIRLLTESIDHEGRLRCSDSKPYKNEDLASVTGFDLEFINYAMEIFEDYELVIKEQDNTLFLPQAVKMIGSESYSAKRMREYRENKTKEKPIKKKDPPKKVDKKQQPIQEEHVEIIKYLNELTGQSYRATTKATQKAINGRLSDGYTVDDFKLVIKSKTDEWLHDDHWRKYLTPDTLFRPSNFEKYLQAAKQQMPQKKQSDVSRKLEEETTKRLAQTNIDDDGGFA